MNSDLDIQNISYDLTMQSVNDFVMVVRLKMQQVKLKCEFKLTNFRI